jgi:hypothetical protein
VELVAEFAAFGGGRLFMMRPGDLLRRGPALAVEVRRESVADAERVSRAALRPTWTADGVEALLAALGTEAWEQAAVIRTAAARGGRIERADVEEICGDDDRALRGFSAPVARITTDLQDAGLVAHDVEPALIPEYADGTAAVAFRVPREIAAILAEHGESG